MGKDYILRQLSSYTAQIRNVRLHVVLTTVDYTGFVDSANFEFQNGQILLTVKGQAKTDSSFSPNPNLSFTITQAFALEVEGATAKIVVNGKVNFVPDAGIYTALNSFRLS